MVKGVVDADFLSAFLKIEALHRVRQYFRADTLLLPPGVLREIAVTTLLPRLTATDWLTVRQVPAVMIDAAAAAAPSGFEELGAGEREAIALAYDLEEAVLLTNDRLARHHADSLGVRSIDIPAFLLLYRSLGGDAIAEVRRLVEALEEKDHYGFQSETRRRLLGDIG